MVKEVGFEGVFAEERGDGLAQAAGEVEDDVAEDAFHVSGPPRSRAVVVFSEGGVEHVEAAVLDFPAATQQAQ